MCGIAGLISFNKDINNISVLKKMTDALSHRGPDGEGFWKTDDNCVNLGHRRLSIIDLSEAGSQPMLYLDRYVIVFNGEIYNYRELKEGLLGKGYKFFNNSDTEVLLALYHDKGEKCLLYLDGMFSFIIYDKVLKEFFCARDRFGEKPFFYCFDQSNLYIASEIKAFREIGVKMIRNHIVTSRYLYLGSFSNPEDAGETFFKDIYKLPPSHLMKFSLNDFKKIRIERYWDINSASKPDTADKEYIFSEIKRLLYESVDRRLRSDVPVGSSLSGGLDSSIIVFIINDILKKDSSVQKTFSAHFPGFSKDEKKYQDIVVRNIKAESFFVNPTGESMLNNMEKVIRFQDEPFSSPSILAQFEVFELAKQNNITVLLDGQGADEIFAGYHGYFHAFFDEIEAKSGQEYREQMESYKILHHTNRINKLLQRSRFRIIRKFLPIPLHKKIKRFRMLKVLRNDFLTDDFQSYSLENLIISDDQCTSLNESLYHSVFSEGLETLLRYADRNSMANSREVRLPFLYDKLVEFAFGLKATFKINNGWTKWVLRKSFEGIVPDEIVWRKDKIGYEPQFNWEDPEFIQIAEDRFKILKSDGIIKSEISANKVFRENSDNGWRLFNLSYY